MNPEYERLLAFAKRYFGSMEGLASEIGVDKGTLYSYKHKKTKIGAKQRKRLEEIAGLSLKWLETGEGEMKVHVGKLHADATETWQWLGKRDDVIIHEQALRIRELEAQVDKLKLEKARLEAEVKTLDRMVERFMDKGMAVQPSPTPAEAPKPEQPAPVAPTPRQEEMLSDEEDDLSDDDKNLEGAPVARRIYKG